MENPLQNGLINTELVYEKPIALLRAIIRTSPAYPGDAHNNNNNNNINNNNNNSKGVTVLC